MSMSKWQKGYQEIFHKAIINQDSENLRIGLANGAVMNNGQNKKNTLNCAIRAMLNQNPDKFNLGFIKDLLDSGAKMCITGNNNILSTIIDQSHKYIKRAKTLITLIKDNGEITEDDDNEEIPMNTDIYEELARKNIKDLLKFITAQVKTWHHGSDILTKVIETNDSDFVKIIIETKPPYHQFTLIDAIQTNNPMIVRIACEYMTQLDLSNTMWLWYGIKIKNPDIVRILLENRVSPCQTQNDTNSFSLAVQTENIEILKMICSHGALPCQSNRSNSLSLAVATEDVEIVKIVCDYGALPCVSESTANTLYRAVETMNPMIISMVIQRGGRLDRCVNTYGHDNLFDEMRLYIIKRKIKDNKQTNHIINLLMCSGAEVVRKDFDGAYTNEFLQTHVDPKIAACYDLLNHQRNDMIDLIKRDLAKTMNDLLETQISVDQIDSATHRIIPIPCVGIIFEYVSLIKFIDWMNY